MADNKVKYIWEDTKGVKQIDGLFQAYTTNVSSNFADWLIGVDTTDEDYRYGHFSPKFDYFAVLFNTPFNNSELRKIIDARDDATSLITALRSQASIFRKQEKRLYNALGCGDFEGFNKLWKNEYYNLENKKIEKREKWLQKHFEFMRGQYQRIFASKDLSLFEQVISLYDIELQKNNIEGFTTLEGETTNFKDEIRKKLLEEKIIQPRGNTYIPTKTYENSKKDKKKLGTYKEQDFFRDVGKQIVELFRTVYVTNVNERFEKWIEEVIPTALSLGYRKARFKALKNKKFKGKNNIPKTLGGCFSKITFGGTYYGKKFNKKLATEQVMNYLDRVRRLTLSSKEWKEWKDYVGEGKDKSKKKREGEIVLEIIEGICNEFFEKYNFGDNTLSTVTIQGILGELATYGQKKLNLKKNPKERKIEIFSVGKELSEHGSPIGTDLVLRVNNKNYGIQIKNPFDTIEGYHETYKKEWDLGTEKSRNYFYSEYLKLDKEEQDIFNFLQVNLNNLTISKDMVEEGILTFLRYYSLEFARLETQNFKSTEKIKKMLGKNLEISNLFFVLKGELIQSSAILEGLIMQYEMATKQGKQMHNQQDLTHKLNIVYTNNIKKQYHEVNPENVDEVRYNSKWINQDINSLLKDINIKISLSLQIPSLAQLGVLRKKG